MKGHTVQGLSTFHGCILYSRMVGKIDEQPEAAASDVYLALATPPAFDRRSQSSAIWAVGRSCHSPWMCDYGQRRHIVLRAAILLTDDSQTQVISSGPVAGYDYRPTVVRRVYGHPRRTVKAAPPWHHRSITVSRLSSPACRDGLPCRSVSFRSVHG